MHFTVLGAGAVGGVVGGLLYRAGLSVTLVARGPHLQALQRDGLRLRTPTWSTTLPVPTSDTVPPDTDVIFLAVKAHQVRRLLPDLPRGTPVVCLQNSIGTEPLIARLEERPVMGAMVWIPALHLHPGEVLNYAHPGHGAIDVGAFTPAAERWVPVVRDALTLAGIESRSTPDIMALKRTKLLINLGSALQAACGAVPPDCLEAVQAEAKAVYAAAGWAFLPIEALTARGFGSAPIDGQARPGGSTWQSVARGAKAETAALHQPLLQAGHTHDVPTRSLTRLTNVAMRLEAPASWAVDDLRHALLDDGDGYSALDIMVLDGLEAVRRRPGLYMADGPTRGRQMLDEVVFCALDACLAQRGGQITVEIDASNFTVRDDGNGLPPKLMLERINYVHGSGRSFSGTPTSSYCASLSDSEWPASGGWVGPGYFCLAPVSAFSRQFSATCTYAGKCTRLIYRYGELHQTTHPAAQAGTTISVERDPSMVPHPFEIDHSRALLERIQALTPAACTLQISLNGEDLPAETLPHYIARQLGLPGSPDVLAHADHDGLIIHAAIWRATTPAVRAFVNFGDAISGDFVAAIQQMHPDPLAFGVHIVVDEPRFQDSTHNWLTSPEAVAAVRAILGPKLRALPPLNPA